MTDGIVHWVNGCESVGSETACGMFPFEHPSARITTRPEMVTCARCSCDREARIAEAVARAIEAAKSEGAETIIEIDENGKVNDPRFDRAVAALAPQEAP